MLPHPSADRAMDLITRQEGAAVVFAVGGELDLDTVAPLAEALGRVARDGAGQAVVLDLSGVTFADSTTVNVLLRARENLGDRLRIATPSAFIQRLFDVIGLGAALSVHSTVASALTDGSAVPGAGDPVGAQRAVVREQGRCRER